MLSTKQIFAFFVVSSSWTQCTLAHSSAPRPLARLEHPTAIALEVIPRERDTFLDGPYTLQHSDSLRLTFTAFQETFHLHLRPNDALVHPNAKITYDNSRTVVLDRASVRAYMGEVVPGFRSEARFREDTAGVIGRRSLETVQFEQSHSTDLGWARIMVHDPTIPLFEGAFSVNGVIHHVTTSDNYLRHRTEHDAPLPGSDSLVIWRDSDVVPKHAPGTSCGHDGLSYNTDPRQNPMLREYPSTSQVGSSYDEFGLPDFGFHSKRQDVPGGTSGTNFVNTIGQTAGCPKTQTVLFMGVAADCEYVSRYGSPENATTAILTNWNTVSALYRSTFNVSMGIVELQVRNAECPATAPSDAPWNVGCSDSVTLNSRLSTFSRWRGTRSDDAGLWHLMSGCPTGTEVGVAWLRTLCQQTSNGQDGSFVSGTGVSTGGRTEWQVVAHEIGHNFGAIHDCTTGCEGNSADCCPLTASSCNGNGVSIMAPSSNGENNENQQFSQCSIGNICSLMGNTAGSQTNTTCLLDANDTKNRQTISLKMCGNGIVESGEDCDPGTGNSSPCCDSATCKFRSGALCDPASSLCCTQQCTYTPANTTCRASKDSTCDTAEMCTGTSSACPEDTFAPNGEKCGDDGLACASGQCTSVSKQCQSVGASLGLTRACPQASSNCQISCADPDRSNACVLLQSQLIDGSPCGTGGICTNGNCARGSTSAVISAWYRDNLRISIPVTIVGGLLVLAILWCILVRVKHCCCGRRVRKTGVNNIPPMAPVPSQNWNYGSGAPPPQRISTQYAPVHQQQQTSPGGYQQTSPTGYPPPQRYSEMPNYQSGYGYGQQEPGYGHGYSGYGGPAPPIPGPDTRPPSNTDSMAPLVPPSHRSSRLTRNSRT